MPPSIIIKSGKDKEPDFSLIALENLLNDLEMAVSKDEGTRLPGQGKVAEEFVVVPDDLLVLLEKLTGLDWKD